MCCYSRRCQGAEIVVVVVEVGAERFFSSRQQPSSSPPTWTGDLGAVKILLTPALLERGILRPSAIKNVLHAVRKYTLTRIHTQTTSIVCTISLEVERVQLANFANDTSNFFLSTLCKTTKSHA